MGFWAAIETDIEKLTGRHPGRLRRRALGGGCINQAWHLQTAQAQFFIKANRADALSMFEAEAAGLQALQACGALRVPRPLCQGVHGDTAYLLMEYLPLGAGDPRAMEALGQGLAAQHRCTQAQFGWVRDNTIGATVQPNPRESDWVTFWREHRLGHQLDLAARNGYAAELGDRGERLRSRLPALLAGHVPPASLLHGDLWSGNYAVLRDGEPVIFDPAVYYGDREVDLAMTELFGGFGARFYAAYRDAWPLDAGYAMRKTLYNLYHILNHLNLFGAGYLSQARAMLDQLLAEAG